MSVLDDDIEAVVVSAEDIRTKITDLARQIDADYADREPLLVGVLKGAVMFMSDLARGLNRPSTMEFMACSSYGSSTTSSGVAAGPSLAATGLAMPRRNSRWAPSSWRVRSPTHSRWAEQSYQPPVRLSRRVMACS